MDTSGRNLFEQDTPGAPRPGGQAAPPIGRAARHTTPPSGGPPGGHRLHRLLLALLAPFLVATLVGVVWLWPPSDLPPVAAGTGGPSQLVDATVREVIEAPCAGTAPSDRITCQSVDIDITSGAQAGSRDRFEVQEARDIPELRAGDELVLGYEPSAPPGQRYALVDYQRETPMLWLAGLFVGVVLLLGRLKGVRALAGLVVSLAVVLWFLLPAILAGSNPVMVALVGCSLVAFVALYVAHGFGPQTTIALLGTLASLVLVGLLAWGFVELSRITGLASEEAVLLQFSEAEVNLQGLVLAGMVIGALGVLDDVTVTQVSAVWELRRANPLLGVRELYRSGLKVGRDHIASTVNTLVLAYTGAALPLLLFLRQADRSLATVLTGETLATEIIRTLVGSIGLTASVPLTTLVAALVASRTALAEMGTDGHGHGH